MNINVVGTSGSGKSTLARRTRTGWNYHGSSSIACTGGRTGRARRMRHFRRHCRRDGHAGLGAGWQLQSQPQR